MVGQTLDQGIHLKELGTSPGHAAMRLNALGRTLRKLQNPKTQPFDWANDPAPLACLSLCYLQRCKNVARNGLVSSSTFIFQPSSSKNMMALVSPTPAHTAPAALLGVTLSSRVTGLLALTNHQKNTSSI